METQSEKQRVHNGQLISVPHKDTVRLLEVYVKRSLSLNDGALGDKRGVKKEKWVTKKQRRHSSDPSLHLADELSIREAEKFSAVGPPASQPETFPEEPEEQTKKSKKKKKSSFWKNIFGFFSRKTNEDKEEEQDGQAEAAKDSTAEEDSDAAITCLPTTPVASQKKKTMRRKSLKRRFSKRRLSLKKTKDLIPADITGVEAVVSVEPTYSYYEKVSEELQKIVHEVTEEVKPLSDEEVTERIIALTKEQGDAIDDKLRDNPTLNNFFQRMTYSSFQKLADAYLEKEATPTHNPPATVPPTAPELIKLAFTFDLTARIAGLARQNIGHITGLGNRYLQDRFEYTQACTDHPRSDSDD